MINNDEPRTWPFEVLHGARLEGVVHALSSCGSSLVTQA